MFGFNVHDDQNKSFVYIQCIYSEMPSNDPHWFCRISIATMLSVTKNKKSAFKRDIQLQSIGSNRKGRNMIVDLDFLSGTENLYYYDFYAQHFENTHMQYTAIFHSCKNDNFQLNFFDFFHILLKTLRRF